MIVGDLFHIAHVVDDLPATEAWYDRVFSPIYMFRRHESSLDHRTASMMLIGDFPAEPMSPYATPSGANGTIGRFRRRFGQRLHSLAFYCDSVTEGYERFRSCGIRVFGDGGAVLAGPPARGGIYTHPRDSFGMIELMEPRVAGRGGASVGDSLGECYDPRLLGTHDPTQWEREHPLGIRRTSFLTVLVDDLDRAVDIYSSALHSTPFRETSTVAAAGAHTSVFVAVGSDSVVELMRPADGSIEAAALERDGAMLWSVTFLVREFEAAAAHLDAVGVTTLREEDRITISTDDARGARYSFVEHGIPGDHRVTPALGADRGLA